MCIRSFSLSLIQLRNGGRAASAYLWSWLGVFLSYVLTHLLLCFRYDYLTIYFIAICSFMDWFLSLLIAVRPRADFGLFLTLITRWQWDLILLSGHVWPYYLQFITLLRLLKQNLLYFTGLRSYLSCSFFLNIAISEPKSSVHSFSTNDWARWQLNLNKFSMKWLSIR